MRRPEHFTGADAEKLDRLQILLVCDEIGASSECDPGFQLNPNRVRGYKRLLYHRD